MIDASIVIESCQNGSLIKVVTKTVAVKVDPYGINNWYYMDFDLRNEIDVLKYTLISAYNSYSPSMSEAQVIAFSYIDGLVIRLIFASKLPNGSTSFNFIFALK